MENSYKGVTFNVWRFSDATTEWLSMIYRATDHIDEANGAIKPFIVARKEMAKKELDGFEATLTPQDISECAKVENHGRALQEWQACSFLRRMFSFKPERPSDEAVATYKRVTDRRAELTNRLANPLMDLFRADGEAMLNSMIKELERVGFKVMNRNQETNGEYVKETVELAFV